MIQVIAGVRSELPGEVDIKFSRVVKVFTDRAWMGFSAEPVTAVVAVALDTFQV